MEDVRILQLFFTRREEALRQTQQSYGKLMHSIALNILSDPRDAEECVNDALLSMWQSIPPAAPENLKAYAAKAVRNNAFNRYKANRAAKRGGGTMTEIYEELENCLPNNDSAEDIILRRETLRAVNRFLTDQPERERNIFLRRYFFAESTDEIAAAYGIKNAAVRLILSRTRAKLKKYLAKEEEL